MTTEPEKNYSEETVACIPMGTNSYKYTFIEDGVEIDVMGLHDGRGGLEAELTFCHPIDTPFFSNIKFSFNSAAARKSLFTQLLDAHPAGIFFNWNSILEYIVQDIAYKWRKAPIIIDINTEPEIETQEYLLSLILALGHPATLFAPGGIGKSTFVEFIAVLLTYGIYSGIGIGACQGPVNILYLDWETDALIHKQHIKAIKKGLRDAGADIPDEHKQIFFIKCEKPLTEYVEYIKQMIQQFDIKLIIIDSQMAATSEAKQGQTEAQVGAEYYNCLRSFGITTLTIDHTSKATMAGLDSTATPYGTIVKYNRSRAQFELKMDDSFENSDHKEYVLVNTKNNLARKQKPLPFAVDFVNEGDRLVSIAFTPCNLADNQTLSAKSLTKVQRLINALKKRPGNMGTIAELADDIQEADNVDAVGATLARAKDIFIKLSTGKYGLISKN
jgi:AAA domain